jgi:spore maturation protein CgeB
MIDDRRVDELLRYVKFEDTGRYNLDYKRVMLDILRKKITVNERRTIIAQIGQRFDTVIYTNNDAAPIENVPNLGTVDYMNKMPAVFRHSKININLTMRSILSGIPLRVLDVLAAGGFLITNYQPEIAEHFEDWKDLIMVKSPEEIPVLIAHFLVEEDKRKEIALRGQKKVLEKFSYGRALSRILGQSNENY